MMAANVEGAWREPAIDPYSGNIARTRVCVVVVVVARTFEAPGLLARVLGAEPWPALDVALGLAPLAAVAACVEARPGSCAGCFRSSRRPSTFYVQ